MPNAHSMAMRLLLCTQSKSVCAVLLKGHTMWTPAE